MKILKKTLLTTTLISITNIVFANTITVNNDYNDGTNSLRQAIANANDGDIIDFSANYIIKLTSPLIIDKDLIFNGKGVTLSGSKLAGTVVGKDCVIKDIELEANASLIGCDLKGNITGNIKHPAQIGAATVLPETTLSNVRLSPTVKLAANISLGEGVILPHNPPIIEDFGIEDITTMNKLQHLEPTVFSLFTAIETAQIPAEAFGTMKGEQLAEFTAESLAVVTSEQLQNLAPETFAYLTSDNMAGFSGEVIKQFTPRHLEMLNPTSFQYQDSKNISKIINNLNSNTITIKNIEPLLPSDWLLEKNGTLTAPIGAKLTAQYLSSTINIPNINLGIGLGGQGVSIKNGLTHSLASQNLTDFVISQQADGILIVEGTGKSAGIRYSFIPDIDNIIQVDTKTTPVGLAIDNGSFFLVTTPEGQQYRLIPVPHNPLGVSEVLDNKPIAIGKNGDVLMRIPQNTKMASYSYYVAIFDPFIESAPDSLCIEIENGELFCDFDLVDLELRPGLHFPRERAGLEFEEARMVYPDATTQTCTPTVYSPETFIIEALKFPGVEKISFNVNGSFSVLHEGKSYILKPSFTTVKTETTTFTPDIVLNDKGGINYFVPVELLDSTRRNSQIMLMFDLFIEPTPDNWCVEVGDNGIFCDFENIPI